MLTHDDQRHLLNRLSHMGSQGRAEVEDRDRLARTFWPVPEHLRAFETDVVLVVGPRGSGKTELFRAVIEMGLIDKFAARSGGLRLPPKGRTKWLAAYPAGAAFPSVDALRSFVAGSPNLDELFREVWLAYLVRVLWGELDEHAFQRLAALNSHAGGDVSAVLGAYGGLVQEAGLALDRLDRRLEDQDRYLFIGYDELDTLARKAPWIVEPAVQGLVAMWSDYARRWRRIRAKVFLRTDLYERGASSGGADFAKLAASRVEIEWSDRNLYALLVRRIANTDVELARYCESARIGFEKDAAVGLLPVLKQAKDARPLIERMVGTYMGAGPKKGVAFRWLLDKVRDGRGHALPRPLVRLVESAAAGQRNAPLLPPRPKLLEPRALRRALDVVSKEQVTACLDEWPWLTGLASRLSRRREVPWERRDIDRHLVSAWDEPWHADSAIRPPVHSAHDLIDYLVEVGVFRARRDGRIDVPDLFLEGLGLKRKGGVKK